ncbi:hypothetical protein RZS08_61910, partial [Arthrospira platensis SPKY1]|nr:hypothetical protein [Arthrospira platensis SPKY1]
RRAADDSQASGTDEDDPLEIGGSTPNSPPPPRRPPEEHRGERQGDGERHACSLRGGQARAAENPALSAYGVRRDGSRALGRLGCFAESNWRVMEAPARCGLTGRS